MKEAMRLEGWMRDVTPGKWVLKNVGTELQSFSRVVKCEDGRKSVQVKEPSCSLLDSLENSGERKIHEAGNCNEHKLFSRPYM